jgi:dTDP-4-dehydrorhamnose 3,5-epimerase
MIFTPTPLAGAVIVDIEPVKDERGFFARTFCTDDFSRLNLDPTFVQCSISFNGRRGTLRGMHFQAAPHEENKLIRCTSGAIFDVIVDIRPKSTSFGLWFGLELTAANRRALFVPEGFAHGFITLADDSEVFYQISSRYVTDSQRGFRWNDPQIGIAWPFEAEIISKRDASLPLLSDTAEYPTDG